MRYRFEITYANKYMLKACKLMENADMLSEGEKICTKQTLTFSTQNQMTLDDVKNTLKKAFEFAGAEVYLIEGGTIE